MPNFIWDELNLVNCCKFKLSLKFDPKVKLCLFELIQIAIQFVLSEVQCLTCMGMTILLMSLYGTNFYNQFHGRSSESQVHMMFMVSIQQSMLKIQLKMLQCMQFYLLVTNANMISSILFFKFKSSIFFILWTRECFPDCIICTCRKMIPFIP